MRTTVSIILSLLIFWDGMAFGAEEKTLTVGGTGSGLGVMRLLAKSFVVLHPEATIEILPSLGTGGGIRALKTGAIDLAIASRELTEKEKDGLSDHHLGASPFVFAVHPATQIDDVTLSQLVDIYDGYISTWQDGSRIRRILRPVEDSDWQFMHNLSPELARALQIARETEGLYLAVTDTDTVAYLERTRGSFGPSTLTMILTEGRQVKILSFDGRQPEVSAPGQEPYPLMKPYYLLTRSDASAAVGKFADFIRSDQGREILIQAGITTNVDQPQ